MMTCQKRFHTLLVFLALVTRATSFGKIAFFSKCIKRRRIGHTTAMHLGNKAWDEATTTSTAEWNIMARIEHHDNNFSSVLTASNSVDNVFEDQDLVVGAIMAVLLASGASFLQSRRNQNDFMLSRPPPPPPTTSSVVSPQKGNATKENSSSSDEAIGVMPASNTFDDWEEMSNPENYIWYKKNNPKKQARGNSGFENPWVLVGLLLLFTPIFSFEFFLTVSRQIICSGILSGNTAEWCTPILEMTSN